MESNIVYRDPELEASFSFSRHYFNSNTDLHVFPDDDDEEGGINDDEYIEIAIEEPRLAYTNTHGEDDGSRHQELELRISFSSTSAVPCSFLEISNNNTIGLSRKTTVESVGNDSETVATPSSSSSLSSWTSTLSCYSAETERGRLTTGHDKTKGGSSIKRRLQFRAVNRLLGSFLSTTPRTSSSEMDGTTITEHESSRQMAIQNTINKLELLRSRKSAKMSRKTSNGPGMMMKFLIKCRSISIRALLASFMKPHQVIISSPQNNTTSGGSGSGGGQIKKKRCNLTSNQSSLLIQQAEAADAGESKGLYAGENSIQAAIAHCKRSFGHASEFSFSFK